MTSTTDVLTLFGAACYDITDCQSDSPCGDPVKPSKPKKTLNKRNTPAKAAACTEAPACEASCGTDGEPETFVMPDLEKEEARLHPEKHRKGLPEGRIDRVCGNCGNVSTIYVDEPDSYDEKARVSLFKERGSSYKPPLCRWCVNRASRAARKKLA